MHKLNDMRNHRFDRGNIEEWNRRRHRSRIVFGLGMAVVGIVLLLKAMGLLTYFSFEYSWPVVLIAVGVLSGIKHNFRNNAWWILILIGVVNLTPQFMIMGQPSRRFVWPALFIVVGTAIALRPRRDHCYPKMEVLNTSINTDGLLDIDVTFGGRKEVVTSKDFKGGRISATFAGCELNLAQADFSGSSVILDFQVTFSGVEIIVPSHWEIQNNINPSFGNVEDERTIQTATTNETKKTLILQGNCSFGNIELKSY
jgi:hypothetical protein